MKRYYMGVDWGDRLHQVYVGDEDGKKVREMKLQESPEGHNPLIRSWTCTPTAGAEHDQRA